MRIYVPSDAGLGAPEISAMRKLSRPSLQIIAEELHEPGSHDAIRWILRQRDPERALADAITENVQQAISDATAHLHGGLSDAGMGKSFFKKLVKINRKVFNAVKKTVAKVAKIDPIYKATAKIRKKVMNVVRKIAPILIMVAGVVLSIAFPAFAPLIALAVSVATTAYKLRALKIDADKAKRAGKAEANQMQAEVDRQTAEVDAQADEVYAQGGHLTFLAAGYDQARWESLTLDQKIDLIQQASAGTLKPTPEGLAALNAATQQTTDAAAAAAQQAAAQQAAASAAPPTQTSSSYSGGGGGGGGVPSGPSQDYGPTPSPAGDQTVQPPSTPVEVVQEKPLPIPPASGGGGAAAVAALSVAVLAIMSSGSGKRK